MTSDQAPYLERAVAVATGDDDAADDLAELTEALGDALAAAIYDGAHACEQLAMAQADDDDQAEADQLVAAAGEVHPLTGFAMARAAGRRRTGGDVVRGRGRRRATNADTRAALAAGPAPGQGGDFADRFRLGDGSRPRATW